MDVHFNWAHNLYDWVLTVIITDPETAGAQQIMVLLCHTIAAVDEPVDHACPFASLSPGTEPVQHK